MSLRIAPAPIARIDLLDLARGGALVAMAIYHFVWDLEFFGHAPPGLSQEFGWKLFARAIASTFLFLVGFSLVLAHGRGIRWRAYLVRLGQIAAAAGLITAATWYAMPDRFIFFGILHQIALASLIGLAFLRLPAPVLIAAAAAAIAAPHFLRAEIFVHPALWWLGLAPQDPVSNDYVPVLPWFGAVLAGMAAGRIGLDSGLAARLSGMRAGPWAEPLRFFGRHGLAFYLIHQPVLIGTLWLVSAVVPSEAALPETRFIEACEASCRQTGDEAFCRAFCFCMLDGLSASGKLDALMSKGSDAGLDDEIAAMAGECRAAAGTGLESEP